MKFLCFLTVLKVLVGVLLKEVVKIYIIGLLNVTIVGSA